MMQMSGAAFNPVTINDRFRCVNAWLAWMFQNGHIPDRIRIPPVKEPQKVTPTFSADDVRRLTSCRPRSYRERRVQAMASLSLDCGLRIQEAIDLCVEDTNVRIVQYDFGRCRQTGYHDAAERFECRDCGASGDADDLIGSESDGYHAPELHY